MRIVFGWYTFKIRSYQPEDLHVPNKEKTDHTFEVRQRVFHFFWIPAFPIGKLYAMRAGRELYHVTDEVRSRIRERKDHRTPWYSFALPILAFVVLLVSALNSSITTSRSMAEAQEMHEKEMARMTRELEWLSPGHCLQLKPYGDEYASEVYVKVISVDGDEIKVLKSNETYFNTPYDMHTHFNKKGATLDTLGLSLKSLRKTLGGSGEPLLGGKDLYEMSGIVFVDGPAL